jgi:hypothetical protein
MAAPGSETPTRGIGPVAVRVIVVEVVVILLLWWAGAHFGA